jgi:glycosyltransferase involved in cell wall biosynthesis
MKQSNNKISVVINTLNEEKNIESCIKSVLWADEIVVVDMYSEDKTVEIAKKYGAKVYMHEKMGYADPARKFAIEKATNEWILVIDADELVTTGLKEAINTIIQENIYNAIYIPRINYIAGFRMHGGGWGPIQDKQLRLFKKDSISITSAVHDFFHLNKNTKIKYIQDPDLAFVHLNCETVEILIQKMNKYTTIEAQNIISGIKTIPTVFAILKEFPRRYIRLGGYRDGLLGFFLSYYMVAYLISIRLKYYQMKKFGEINVSEKIRSTFSETIA